MPKNIKNYTNYELFDFLLDPDFKKWILNPTDEINSYWKQVLETYPQQADVIEKAAKIVKNLPAVPQENGSSRAQKLWDNIEEEISAGQTISTKPSQKLRKYFSPYIKYAAIFVAVLGIILSIYNFQKTAKIVVATGNGENKEVVLPDGSILQLAPNSSISYRKNIVEQKQREVWATGEVNFNVKHFNKNPDLVKKGERFVVHLNRSVNVSVLGTVFNISDRKGSAIVHLESGSVKITKSDQELLLKPGQSAISNSHTPVLSLNQAPPKLTHEWENHILNLNKTKISTIIEIINDNYGVHLDIEDKSLLNKEIDGAVPLDDLEKTLKIVSSVTGGKVVKHDNLISIKK